LADPYDFAAMLVDLNTLARPRFCVMDGIVAMEGMDPKRETRQRLLFSTDPALDDHQLIRSRANLQAG
jgi:uncharacterized protein (DUF362 family)